MSCGLWFGLVVFGFLFDSLAPETLQPTSLRAEVVDVDINSISVGDWKGKLLNEIVPARMIKRIVRVTESGCGREAGRSGEQADYDAILAHFVDSTAAATDSVLVGNEGGLAELPVITKEGEILCIEVVGTQDPRASRPRSSSMG